MLKKTNYTITTRTSFGIYTAKFTERNTYLKTMQKLNKYQKFDAKLV